MSRSTFSYSNPLTIKKTDEEFNESGEEENDFLENTEGFRSKQNKRKEVIPLENSSDEEANGKDEAKSDDDMFSDSDEEEKKSEEQENKKVDDSDGEVELLDNKELEKQLLGDTDKVDSLDEEKKYVQTDDEEEENQKEIKFTSFGLKEELKEGRFDANQNFIRYESEDEDVKAQDIWLKGIKKSDIIKAKEAEEKAQELQRKKRLQDEAKSSIPLSELLERLIVNLELGETPEELLQRLQKKSSKITKKYKNKAKNKQNYTTEETHKLTEIKRMIDTVTEIINLINKIGKFDNIYDNSKEEIIRFYQKETGKQFSSNKRRFSEVEEPLSEKKWEFQWIGKGKIYGPYTSKEISDWKRTYFQNKVMVRPVNTMTFQNISDWTGE